MIPLCIVQGKWLFIVHLIKSCCFPDTVHIVPYSSLSVITCSSSASSGPTVPHLVFLAPMLCPCGMFLSPFTLFLLKLFLSFKTHLFGLFCQMTFSRNYGNASQLFLISSSLNFLRSLFIGCSFFLFVFLILKANHGLITSQLYYTGHEMSLLWESSNSYL